MSFLELCSDIYCAKVMSGERFAELETTVSTTIKEAKELLRQATEQNPFAIAVQVDLQTDIPEAQ